MENGNTNPEQVYTSMLVTWGALLMAQVMFLVIVFVTKPELAKFEFTQPILGGRAAVITAFFAVAVTALVVGMMLKKRFLERSVTEQKVGLVQTAMIVCCALGEVGSLLGLLLAFMYNYPYFYLFVAIGAIGIALSFPRRSDVHAASYKT